MTSPTRLPVMMLTGLVLVAGTARAQLGAGPHSGFPTLDATDARMVSFSCGAGGATADRQSFTLAADPGATSITLSVFDGETGADDGAGLDHWDAGALGLVYRLYFDPTKSGNRSAGDLVGEWFGNEANPLTGPAADPDRAWTASAAMMPNNDWWGLTLPVSDRALSESGLHFYHLEVAFAAPCPAGDPTISNFKLASTGPLSKSPGLLSVEASLRSPLNTGPIVYDTWDPPNYLASATTYDGRFDLAFDVLPETQELRLYDGDFDFGTRNLSGLPSGVLLTECVEQDDPDTAASYAGWPFVPPGAVAEGLSAPALPPDDSPGDLFRRGEPGNADRVGCVRYELIDPAGTVYRNDDPSGSGEWEQFRVAAGLAASPNEADYGPAIAADGATFVAGDTLPAGTWTLRIVGLDLSNGISLYLDRELCAERAGAPACPGSPYTVTGTVFFDLERDGALTAGTDPGATGVDLLLRDGSGTVSAAASSGTAGADPACTLALGGSPTPGSYCLGASTAGGFDAEVISSNLTSGGALSGLASTTGGDSQAVTVGPAGATGIDFGYLYPSLPVTASGPVFNARILSLMLTNSSSSPVLLSSLGLDWPTQNGPLRQVRVGAALVFDGNDSSRSVVIDTEWIGTTADRVLAPGASVQLEIEFASTARTNLASYAIVVGFGDGSSLDVLAGELPSPAPTPSPGPGRGKGKR